MDHVTGIPCIEPYLAVLSSSLGNPARRQHLMCCQNCPMSVSYS